MWMNPQKINCPRQPYLSYYFRKSWSFATFPHIQVMIFISWIFFFFFLWILIYLFVNLIYFCESLYIYLWIMSYLF